MGVLGSVCHAFINSELFLEQSYYFFEVSYETAWDSSLV